VAWLAAWWALYRHPSLHPHVKRGELDWIRQDAPIPPPGSAGARC
jgi:ACS family hexuronate transporter-like MFS transporter